MSVMTAAVITTIQPTTDNIATQLALLRKEKLVRMRKQAKQDLPVSPATRVFEIPEIFEIFQKFDGVQNDHGKIMIMERSRRREMLSELQKSNFWLADANFKNTPKMLYQPYSITVSLSATANGCIFAFFAKKGQTYLRV